jgi:hypothetical protein
MKNTKNIYNILRVYVSDIEGKIIIIKNHFWNSTIMSYLSLKFKLSKYLLVSSTLSNELIFYLLLFISRFSTLNSFKMLVLILSMYKES